MDPTVVDVDAHFLEGVLDITDYLDEADPWRMRLEASPKKTTPGSSPDHYLFGRIQRDEVGYLDGRMAPEEVPATMDHLGLDKIVLLSHTALPASGLNSDDRRPTVLARGYMEYMLDRVVDPDEGIFTVIPVPHKDPGATVELIDDYHAEAGVVGTCVVSSGPEPPMGHRRYEPIYAAAQDRDLPVIFHAGDSGVDRFQISGYERFIESHSLGFLWSNMAQLTSIVIQGVPEKFPDLDFVFQESGITWVPAFMGRLDAEFLKRQSEAPLLERRPSEYMREFYYGIQPLEHYPTDGFLEAAIDALGGADQLMYASDYPHWDYDPPSTVTEIPFLADDEKAKILGGNAGAVFDL